jgi:hypothetical protein
VSPHTSKQASILFCPFCREGFEDTRECPEHELTLVPLDRLPRRRTPASNEAAFFIDPRLGRGPVLLGAALVIAGFLAPGVSAPGVDASALEVAIDGAYNLWLTPGAALVILFMLSVRRSRRALREARMAVLGLALAAALPLVYTARRIDVAAETYGSDVEWRWGLAVMVVGLVVTALGSVRLGGGHHPAAD